MKEEFISYIRSISETPGIHIVANQAASGATTLLLDIAKKNIESNKRVLFIDSNMSVHNHPNINELLTNDNFNVLSYRDINFFTPGHVNIIQRFDVIIIDSLNHYVEMLAPQVNQGGIARLSRASGMLMRIINRERKPVIVSNNVHRNFNHNADNMMSMVGGASVAYEALTCLFLERLDTGDTRVKLVKNRTPHFNIEFTVRFTENLSFIDGIIPDKDLFFKEEIEYNREYFLFKLLHETMDDYFLDDYLNGYSRKRKEKFRDILFLNDGGYNFYFLNTFEFLKIYNNFNIDDFILEEDKFNSNIKDYSLRTKSNLSIEQYARDFFKNYISYKRAVKLFADYSQEDSVSGLSLVYAIGAVYKGLVEDYNMINNLNIETRIDINTILNKNKFKKKDMSKILLYLEDSKRNLEALIKEHRDEITGYKQKVFKENNISFKDDYYLLEVPVTLDDIVEGGGYFKNCTKSGFFLERFMKSSNVLFYLKNKNDKDKDLCVEATSCGDIVEIAGISNGRIMKENSQEFIRLKNKIKFN